MLHHKKEKSKSVEPKETQFSYVGVDLSLQKLDVWMEGKHVQYTNTEAGFNKLLKAIRKSKKPVLVAFESTGSISIYFSEQLDREGIARACLNPAWIRHHAKSIGQVAKTDCIDSKMIAGQQENDKEDRHVESPLPLLRPRALPRLLPSFASTSSQ